MADEKEGRKAELKISDWNVKVIVWEQLARNPHNISSVQRHFELYQGTEGYPDSAPDRATIRKLRSELFWLDSEMISLLPQEVQAYIFRLGSKRPK